jgi:hypothetical protein
MNFLAIGNHGEENKIPTFIAIEVDGYGQDVGLATLSGN